STAIEAVGILRDKNALPALIDALNNGRDVRVRRAALEAIAMLPDPSNRAVYVQYLNDKDEKMRAAAAEGFARLGNTADLAVVQKAWDTETNSSPRLSLALAKVARGRIDMAALSPLQYLVDTLTPAAYNGIAKPFLIELARKENVRKLLYAP